MKRLDGFDTTVGIRRRHAGIEACQIDAPDGSCWGGGGETAGAGREQERQSEYREGLRGGQLAEAFRHLYTIVRLVKGIIGMGPFV
jgi:hypothetical protein